MLTTKSIKPLFRRILALDLKQFDLSLHRISSESLKSADRTPKTLDVSCLYIKDKNHKTDFFVMLNLNVGQELMGTMLTSGRYNYDTQILEIECFGNKELTGLFEFVKKFVTVKEYAQLIDDENDKDIPYVDCYGYATFKKAGGVGYEYQISKTHGQIIDLEESQQIPSYGRKLNILMSHLFFGENNHLENTGPLASTYNKALEMALADIQKSLQKDIDKLQREIDDRQDKNSDDVKAKIKELSELRLEYDRNVATVVV